MNELAPLLNTISDLRQQFTELLPRSTGGTDFTIEGYHRYLSMQYHLTKGVQRYFLTAAAHSSLSRMRRLRRFLFDFANEEELHYLVAAKDIRALGRAVLPEPFDVQLWHAYFTQEVVSRPFVRLGAASVLENLSSPENRSMLARLLKADFLSVTNTKFFVLHMHETLPHGDQLLDALGAEVLDDQQLADLVEGARKGGVLYLRMVDWALNPSALSRQVDLQAGGITSREIEEIEHFDVAELGL
jgi:hypothetical protein